MDQITTFLWDLTQVVGVLLLITLMVALIVAIAGGVITIAITMYRDLRE